MASQQENEPNSGPPSPEPKVDKEEEETKELVVLDPNQFDLDLSHGRIAKIENLEVLTRIETICLRWNLVKTIENLSTLTTLTELDLYDNQITEIENLDTLVNLEQLDISFNRIRQIKGLDKYQFEEAVPGVKQDHQD